MSSTMPRLDLLRSLTDEHILRALMEQGRLTRAEIASRTGISKPTISEGMRRLEEGGLVVDSGERTSGRGRAGTYYTIAPGSGAALVVSITAHGVVAESVDSLGTVVVRHAIPLDRYASTGEVARALEDAARSVQSQTAAALRVAVVSAADPVGRESGRLVQLPDAPFLVGDLDASAVLRPLVEGPVLVDNDVNWTARAEHAGGAVAGVADFIYLYLGEGLGCAVVSDGQVRRGNAGLAGEIAHVVVAGPEGRATPFTAVFGELGLRQEESTAIDVALLRSRLGDTGDGELLCALAVAVSGVVMAAIALADPAVVVVGGPWGGDENFVERLRAECAGLPREARLVVGSLVEEPELAGARHTALQLLRDTIVAAQRG